MPKISDTQAVLLAHAAQREDGSLYPLPSSLTASGGIYKSIASLLKNGLAEQKETRSADATYRTDDDVRFGVFVTAAGLAAINIVPDDEVTPNPAPTAPASPPKPMSNADRMLEMLTRPQGASLSDIVAATGWLPHSTRAALTGLRKKGVTIERFKREGATCYRKVGAA